MTADHVKLAFIVCNEQNCPLLVPQIAVESLSLRLDIVLQRLERSPLFDTLSHVEDRPIGF